MEGGKGMEGWGAPFHSSILPIASVKEGILRQSYFIEYEVISQH